MNFAYGTAFSIIRLFDFLLFKNERRMVFKHAEYKHVLQACCIHPWECSNALRTSRYLASFIRKLIHAAEGRRVSEEIDSKLQNLCARAIFRSFSTDACCFIVVLYRVALKLLPHIILSLISMILLSQICVLQFNLVFVFVFALIDIDIWEMISNMLETKLR